MVGWWDGGGGCGWHGFSFFGEMRLCVGLERYRIKESERIWSRRRRRRREISLSWEKLIISDGMDALPPFLPPILRPLPPSFSYLPPSMFYPPSVSLVHVFLR